MKENLKELVAVRMFKDNHKYNADDFVSENCNNYVIRRGGFVSLKAGYMRICTLRMSMRKLILPIRIR